MASVYTELKYISKQSLQNVSSFLLGFLANKIPFVRYVYYRGNWKQYNFYQIVKRGL